MKTVRALAPTLFSLLVLSGVPERVLAPGVPPADAGTGAPATPPVTYLLSELSYYVIGCFGPCACPVMSQGPVQGSFQLSSPQSDDTYEVFTIDNVDWLLEPGSNTSVRGSGIYRITRAQPRKHQMELDLIVGDRPQRHFDSGLVPGGEGFPRVDIDVAANGFFCWDTVFSVRAAPATAGVPRETRPGARLRAAGLNPFRDGIDLEVDAGQSDPVDLRIFDMSGRELRVLAAGEPGVAGPRLFRWDGRRGDGSEAPAGIYLVRLKSGGHQDVRLVAKVR